MPADATIIRRCSDIRFSDDLNCYTMGWIFLVIAIPVILQAASLLAGLTHPNRLPE
ncbi:hypothetical protein [Budvicia aquatica]|uniref:hypothetical protein n=1 Tax=Budvicia aquatica TaxID=82979 RepID=UPI00040B684C|nr:hypothetical protein [Budvicia aquatica]MBP9643390.1 hypothetical protein [Budvicia sp.]